MAQDFGEAGGSRPGDRRRVHVWVSGRVQGVGYRDFAREAAQSLQIEGWVRNLSDGRVEAVGQGPADRLQWWVSQLRQGPMMAHVDELTLEWEPARSDLFGFQVRR